MSQQKEHHDISYLKSPEIGKVISKGLATVYNKQPKNPVQFLANWLLNYSATSEAENTNELREKDKAELINKFKEELEALEEDKQEGTKKESDCVASEEDFEKKLVESDDLEDLEQSFVNHILKNTGATSVYFGHRQRVKKPVADEDDDQAHIDPEGKEIVKFLAVDEPHTWLLERILEDGQGVTFNVWKEPEVDPDAEVVEPELDENGEPKEVAPKEEQINTVYVPSVVVKPDIHYFEVPRLGSYFAIPITVKRYLNEPTLDKAFEERVKNAKDRAEKEAERERVLGEIEQRREEGEDPEVLDREEIPSVDSIVEADFDFSLDHFVLCINTLGQDTELTEEQQKYIVEWSKKFRDNWSRAEHAGLDRDVNARIERNASDEKYSAEFGETENENENTRIEDEFKDVQEIEDEERELRTNVAKMDHNRNVIMNDIYKPQLLAFKQEKVIKLGHIFQSVFYLLGYKKEEICEEGTNLLNWKKTKQLLNDDFFKRVKEYDPRGPKNGVYPAYAMIPKLEAVLNTFEQENVDAYSLAIGHMFKWIKFTIEARKGDIQHRRDVIDAKKKERIVAEENRTEWEKARAEFVEDARKSALDEWEEEQKAKAEAAAGEEEDGENAAGGEDGEEKPVEEFVFNEKPSVDEFERDNSIEPIPDVVVDDEDNDFGLPPVEEQ